MQDCNIILLASRYYRPSVSLTPLLLPFNICQCSATLQDNFNESPRYYSASQLAIPLFLIIIVCLFLRWKYYAHTVFSSLIHTNSNEAQTTCNFLDDAVASVLQMYHNWTVYDPSQETICIPSCAEVCDDLSNISPSGQAGRAAEQLFLRRFYNARCGLGGVLIANLNFKKFYNYIKDKNISEDILTALQKLFGKKSGRNSPNAQDPNFEWDFLFLHPYLGIYVIEVKCSEAGSVKENHSQYIKARSQILSAPRKLHALFRALTGATEDDCDCLPIRGIICFPHASLKNIKKHKDIVHLDEAHFKSQDALKRFFKSKIKWHRKKIVKSSRNRTFFHTPNERKFASAIIGSRSAVLFCQGTNAVEVHRRLHNQEFQKRNGADGSNKILLDCADGQSSVIFLHQSQLAALECTDKRQLFFGFLGSGKTLLIMFKALAAAKRPGNGRVLVAVHAEALVVKYDKFFAANHQGMIRRPVVKKEFLNQEISSSDDFFADEAGFSKRERQLFKDRVNASGLTVVAVSGRYYPEYLPRAIDKCERRVANLPTPTNHSDIVDRYSRFTLSVVLRNTKAIADYWAPHVKYKLTVGHNIHGTPVDLYSRPTIDDVKHLVVEKLDALLRAPKTGGRHLLPKDVAVLTGDPADLTPLLTTSGFKCGSVVQQLNDQSLIAVDTVEQTLSLDWPVVVFVDVYGPLTKRLFNHSLLASSRAMARLIVIELKQIDRKKFQGGIPHSFSYSVRSGGDDDNADIRDRLPDDGSAFGDALFSSLCSDNIWPALRKISLFSHCCYTSDCLRIVFDDPFLMRQFVLCSKVFRLTSGGEKTAVIDALKQRDPLHYYQRRVDSLDIGNDIWRELLIEFLLKWHDEFMLLVDKDWPYEVDQSTVFAKIASAFSLSSKQVWFHYKLRYNVGWINTFLAIDFVVIYRYLPE